MRADLMHNPGTRARRPADVHSVAIALITVSLLALNSGCAARGRSPAPPDPDPERARAALATLHVDNQTAQQLEISYRIAGRTDARVVIGRVAAGSTAEMAPVPAGEPLVVGARTNSGAELTLPPRTFAIDGEWTWRIERNAHFVPPGSESGSGSGSGSGSESESESTAESESKSEREAG